MELTVQRLAAAEGGVFRDGGSMSYGLYLNSSAGNLGTTLALQENNNAPGRVDLF